MTEDVRISLRVPGDLWERICVNAEKAGRTRVAEMIGRLERGEKVPSDLYPPPVSAPYEPKRLLGAKQKLEARARQEEVDLVEALSTCAHESVTLPGLGVFCSRCGVRL